MVGPASFIALWILAATPGGSAIGTDVQNGSVKHVRFVVSDATAEKRAQADEAAPMPPPRPLPHDPAYDGHDLAAAPSGEGIPGLPPVKEEPAKPSEAAPKPETPTSEEEHVGEAACSDAVGPKCCDPTMSSSDGEVCGRSAGPNSGRDGWRSWLDGFGTESWLDQGVTLNTLSPRNRTNGPVTFNDRSNDYQLNQLYLRFGRDVNRDGEAWDVGGRIDFLYGTDSIYTVARGLEVRDDLSPRWNAQRYGLAMPQAYAEVYSPWGNGMSMKLGHFYSLFGYETVTAPENFFYSHSYVFQYGEPFTYTGLIGASKFGDFTVQAGMSRGDNNWEDNNNDLSFVGGISWTSSNERTKISLNVDAGREQPDPSTNVRTVYSLVIQQKLGDRWQYVIQNDYGNEPGAGVGGTVADWYGVNQYLYCTLNERWKAGMRFEWFHDGNGARVPGAGRTGDYYELTSGVNWTPTERLLVRSELRWDFAGTPDLLPYGDNTRSNQLLLDFDVVLRF